MSMIIQGKETSKTTKYLDVIFFKDKIVIFKHFSRKNHHFHGKMKNWALFKHYTEIQALFKACTHPALLPANQEAGIKWAWLTELTWRPSDAIGSGNGLLPDGPGLMAPSHYLNQCWLIISKV